jgi:hypothetical protein
MYFNVMSHFIGFFSIVTAIVLKRENGAIVLNNSTLEYAVQEYQPLLVYFHNSSCPKRYLKNTHHI